MNGTGCVICVVNYQRAGHTSLNTEPLQAAIVVYKGMSLCIPHFNTERNHPAHYGLSDTPFSQQTLELLGGQR